MTLQSSYIYLQNLRFHAHHGVLPQERSTGGDYLVSIRLGSPVLTAMQTDNIADTISYAEVFECIKDEMKIPSCLLEHVAGRIADRLFRQFPSVESIDLSVTKVNPPMGADCDGAGIELHLINNKSQ